MNFQFEEFIIRIQTKNIFCAMDTTVKALYSILEKNELDKKTLQAEEIGQLKKALGMLGYNLCQWYDAKTLVVTADEEDAPITAYEVAALDILVNIANTEGGVPKSEFAKCTITEDLIREGWIVVDKEMLRLSKRTRIEKADILSEKAEIAKCTFCSILNSEGNVPHEECMPYIENSGSSKAE